MTFRLLGATLAAVAFFGPACTTEESTPIDLNATVTTTTSVVPTFPDDDPNAAARNQVIELAKEQCRLHPEREFGVVVIADTEGNEVNRYEFPCAELDPIDGGGSDAG